MCGCARQCDQQLQLSMSNPMGSKISVQIERALLGKSSDVGISALDIDSGRMTGYSEVRSREIVTSPLPTIQEWSSSVNTMPSGRSNGAAFGGLRNPRPPPHPPPRRI